VLSKAGGAIRFSTKITDTRLPAHEPVVLKERIVFPTDATLELYRRDGRFERSYKTTSSLRTNAVGAVNGSRVFFGVDSPLAGRIVCVETNPGQYKPVDQKWELMSNRAAQIDSAPATLTGVVYVAFADGAVYAVNQDTRASIWETSFGPTFQTYGPVQADLRVDDFGLYVPSTDTKFYCLDKTQGKQKWVYFAGSPLRETPQITATMCYLPVGGRGIVAIDKLNGGQERQAKWVVKDAIKLVAEDEKYAYLQRSDNLITAVDKQTGEQRFTSRRNDLVAFATNTKDSTIYAASKDGTVMAIVPVLKPGDVGEVAWLDLGEGTAVAAVAME
jgi:outer membrane protein assembly factor BamB